MELMARYEDNYFDLAIVDPPYGIDASLVGNGSRSKKYNRTKKKSWDFKPPTQDYFNELKRVSKNQIIWGFNYYLNISCKHFIVWDKKQPDGITFAQAELAYTSFSGTSKIFKYSANGQKNRIHPTQKPVKLYEWLLMNYAKEGGKILDTHLGSGSIAIACHNLGFNLTACELDTEYFNKATERIEQHKRQLRMF
jgi:site-specific DNA-methyltransferase (adenine-specific)